MRMRICNMRTGISFEVSPPDRRRLEALVRDRNTAQKHVWRAEIVLLSGDARCDRFRRTVGRSDHGPSDQDGIRSRLVQTTHAVRGSLKPPKYQTRTVGSANRDCGLELAVIALGLGSQLKQRYAKPP